MAAARQKTEILVIAGPTASGKSSLAIRVAEEFDGEIISADSRTIYKGMNIGTAKPTAGDRKHIPHWGLDLVEPGDSFSAFQFKQYSQGKITDIADRGKLPIVVGGTGLYIDSLVFDFEFGPPPDLGVRKQLEECSIEQLQQIIRQSGHQLPENKLNKRHLIRAVERAGQKPQKKELKKGVKIVGLDPGSEILKKRIEKRVEKMFETGFLDEVRHLINMYGQDRVAKTGGIGYVPAISYINGEIGLEEAKKLFKQGDWQYARRQRTWFRRNPFIQWHTHDKQAFTDINTLLNK